jgi:hypothetical protein
MRRVIAVLALSGAAVACAAGPRSVLSVIGASEALNGQTISVVGYVTFEFEGHGIYQDEASLKAHAFDRSVALEIYQPVTDWNESELARWHQIRDKYAKLYEGKRVLAKGKYRSGPGGHLGVVKGGAMLVEQISLHK